MNNRGKIRGIFWIFGKIGIISKKRYINRKMNNRGVILNIPKNRHYF